MIIIKNLGIQYYEHIWQKMRAFTAQRHANTQDEIWLLEHFPIYTQGQAGKSEHILATNNIPIIHSDRGGQVTYHGPGQLIAYILINLQHYNIGIKTLVCRLEQMIIKLLMQYHIIGSTICGAPGVYVDQKKIASLGLRVKNNCTYHGVAINVKMDLQPFKNINPCGMKNLQMVNINDFYPAITIDNVITDLTAIFNKNFQNFG